MGRITSEITEREIHLINVRENGTYIQLRVIQHCSRIIHYELGFKDFDYHSLHHPYVKTTTKFKQFQYKLLKATSIFYSFSYQKSIHHTHSIHDMR